MYTDVGLLCGSGIHFVAKAILFLCFFGCDPYILFRFLKCFWLFLFWFYFLKIQVNFWSNTWWLFCFIYSIDIFCRNGVQKETVPKNLLQYYNYLLLKFLHPFILNMFLHYSCFNSICKWLSIIIIYISLCTLSYFKMFFLQE